MTYEIKCWIWITWKKSRITGCRSKSGVARVKTENKTEEKTQCPLDVSGQNPQTPIYIKQNKIIVDGQGT